MIVGRISPEQHHTLLSLVFSLLGSCNRYKFKKIYRLSYFTSVLGQRPTIYLPISHRLSYKVTAIYLPISQRLSYNGNVIVVFYLSILLYSFPFVELMCMTLSISFPCMYYCCWIHFTADKDSSSTQVNHCFVLKSSSCPLFQIWNIGSSLPRCS